ncbi:MAG: 23S rRNA (guanosine(2251)-2'-O)-methyltransferase RlmB [Solirubrobacteraceae bacterium]
MNESNFIYGVHPILEAINANKTIEKIFVLKESQNEQVSKIIKLCRAKDITVKFVPNEKLNRLTNKNHQGICAFLSPVVFHSIEELVPKILENKKNPIFLILSNITDVRNFGAITRSAECNNVDAIIIPNERSAALNEDAIKTSAGAIFNIPICKEKNLIDVVDILKQYNIKIYSASEKANKFVYEADFSTPIALIFGSEEYGIDKKLLERSDEILKLPILGKIQSLNVSVACGVFLYEVIRQRN